MRSAVLAANGCHSVAGGSRNLPLAHQRLLSTASTPFDPHSSHVSHENSKSRETRNSWLRTAGTIRSTLDSIRSIVPIRNTALNWRTPKNGEPVENTQKEDEVVAWDPVRYHSHRKEHHHYLPTKYPIVLLHGLFGYNTINVGPQARPFLQIHYWRGLAETLQRLGCEVHVPSTGAVSSIRSRALALDAYLTKTLPNREVNLIAHSMGGLDARYLVTHILGNRTDAAYSINSLTTIATPHRGSSFMDFVQEVLGVGYKLDMEDPVVQELERRKARGELVTLDHPIRSPLKSKYKFLKGLCQRFDQPAYANLTREYCDAFNTVTPNISTVYYNSYSAVSKISPLDPLYIPQQVIQLREGANDGLVSVESSKWGDFEGLVKNVDHWGLLPPRSLGGRKRSLLAADEGEAKKRIPAGYCGTEFYMKVVDTLRRKGF